MKQFVLSAFADEAAPGIEAQIEALKRNAISMLEIRNIEGRNIVDLETTAIKRIGARLAAHGIRVSSIASPIGKVSVCEDLAEHRLRFERAMEAAALLGTDQIRIFSFYLPEKLPPEQYTGLVLQHLSEMTERAAKRNLYLCHENEKEIFGEQPECVKLLTDTIQNEFFKTVFDPANYIQAGADPLAAYRITKDSIRYFHIKDAKKKSGTVVPAGAGDGEIRRILRDAVDDTTFPKPICLTVEPHLAVFEGYQNLGDTTSIGTDCFRYQNNEDAFDAACGALKQLLRDMACSF